MAYVESDSKKHQSFLLTAISITFAVAIFVCVLVDLILNRAFTWSLYTMASCVFAWLTILPLIKLKKHHILASLCMFSILVIPFLFAIEFASPEKGWMVPLGIPISIVSLAFVWIAGIILLKIKLRIWYKASVIALLAAPLAYFINNKASVYSKGTGDIWDVINALFLVGLSVFLFVMGIKKKSQHTE